MRRGHQELTEEVQGLRRENRRYCDSRARLEESVDYVNQQARYQTAAASPGSIANNEAESHACYQQSSPLNEEPNPSNAQLNTSAQPERNSLCGHYQRLCLVNFGCCAGFFPCQRCHNISNDCDVDDRMAVDAIRLRCSLCHYEGDITEDSQTCPGCNQLMSEYYCAKCKHFTSMNITPFHCNKCGICRINKEENFHCDVCNVCLDIRLQGNHKCRENSGHDECCICLEDAFGGCRILPCSHKIHRECAIELVKNGIRTCPVCRSPLYTPLVENSN